MKTLWAPSSHAHQAGFTLLEVMLALLILALIATIVSQTLHQRTEIALTERQRLPLIQCARALETEFQLTHYWPSTGRHEGQKTGGQRVPCYWRLKVSNTPVKRLRRGKLTLFAEPERLNPVVSFTLFLAPAR
ncbi:type II secretion system protein GspI [Terasakiispira papahanaumokuakeensis]|uniref:Type II secretion system protein GspI n=1 Tax=Terasakiispira papahanaumokuakeensis TaxID=197479 RepID=A0A1E2VCZ1_9GAMM|nr:type II secretion system protein GspI [Terasakiispira papahanaumokuakeensis]ODC04888.1 type II secretion system protein GspI [Terasakiispira papahanaumokuakeensis]